MAGAKPLYGLHELAYRTQYAELKERASVAGNLLPGTPGILYKRTGTGSAYWYRVYYPVPGKQAEEFVGRDDDPESYETISDCMPALSEQGRRPRLRRISSRQ
jgi:hypothetical protein